VTLTPDELMHGLHKMVNWRAPVVRYTDPFKVLISTVLSQRTRDENTQVASARLFARLDTPEKLARAPTHDVEELIKPSGFYRVKAQRIHAISKDILTRFNGKTPDSIEQLLTLPGVGRKTANCVLVYGFERAAIPVDVHVHRISNRLGIVESATPEETEALLVKMIPEKYWIEINHLMVLFGRQTCLARNPKCPTCVFNAKCAYWKKNKQKNAKL